MSNLGFVFGAVRATQNAGRLTSRWKTLLPQVFRRDKSSSSPVSRQFTASRWWSIKQQAVNCQVVSFTLPGRVRFVGVMGSGGSKNKDKKGSEGKQKDHPEQQQQQQEQAVGAEKTVGESEQQAEQAKTCGEEKMAEEFVEAVVAKASEFGDNE